MGLLANISPITAPNSYAIGYINPPTNTLLPKVLSIGLGVITIPLLAVQVIGALGGDEWKDAQLAKITGRRSSGGSQTPKPNDLDQLEDTLDGYELLRSDGVWVRNGLTGFRREQIKGFKFFANDTEALDAGNTTQTGVLLSYFKAIRPIQNGSSPIQFGGSEQATGLSSGKEEKLSQGLATPISIVANVPSSAIGTVSLLGNTQSPANLNNNPPPSEEKKLPPPPELLKSPPPLEPPPPSTEERQKEEKKTERQKEEEKQKERQEEQKRIVQPPPATGDTNRILQELIRVGSISALIRANTEPQAQRNNSKNGACDALNSPSCTKGVEDRIKDPINNKVDDVAGKVAATASSLDLIKNVADNSFKFISRIYNNQFVHSSLSFMTTMTTIHNAAMLSRDVAETLGTVVDNSVNLSGQKLKDADGNDISFTSWIGTNIRALIVQLIGADKYVQLALQWQKANTIYHSAMAVVNTTESMLNPLSSAVEYGMENVSKIGNGLREDGVVSENSYPAMDETIRARRVNRFERLNDTLEGAENISSNLSSITGSAVSVKEDFRQLREDQKQLRDQAANFNTADEQARAEIKASLPTQITPLNLAPAPEEEETP